MRRRSSASVAWRNEAVLERLRELKAEHPFWGYRHCWAHLRYVDRLDVNKKRVYRLLQEHNLLATQTKHEVSRVSTGSKPRPDRPKQWWGITAVRELRDCSTVSHIRWLLEAGRVFFFSIDHRKCDILLLSQGNR